MALFKKRKVALALGGGAARGFANIGVLKVFERERVPVDLIIGSSIGALAAALYSLGIPTYRMEEAALQFSIDKLTDFSLSKKSIIKGKKLEKIIYSFTDSKKFKDARIPLAITATDIESGEEVVFTKGDLQKLIQASCSWPGIFPPVEVDGRMLGDGGIRNSIPVKMARQLGASTVIAVQIGFCVKKGKMDNLLQMFLQSIQILGEELDRYQSSQADINIQPNLENIDQLAFDKAQEMIQNGEKAAERAMPEIRRKLGLNNFGLWKT